MTTATTNRERYAAAFDLRDGSFRGIDRYSREVDGWFHHSDGAGDTDTCAHLHRTVAAAERCGQRR